MSRGLFAVKRPQSQHTSQKEKLKRGIDDKELGVDPNTRARRSGVCTCSTGGDLHRCPDLQVPLVVGVFFVSELTSLEEERLFQGLLLYVFPSLKVFWAVVVATLALVQKENSVSAWSAMSVKSA